MRTVLQHKTTINIRLQMYLVVVVVVVVVVLCFTTLLTSHIISVAFYSVREKSDKFCSEALISAWGSFTCRKSMTRDPRLYLPSEGSRSQDFYALKNLSTPAGIEPANLGSRGEYDNRWTTGVDAPDRSVCSVGEGIEGGGYTCCPCNVILARPHWVHDCRCLL